MFCLYETNHLQLRTQTCKQARLAWDLCTFHKGNVTSSLGGYVANSKYTPLLLREMLPRRSAHFTNIALRLRKTTNLSLQCNNFCDWGCSYLAKAMGRHRHTVSIQNTHKFERLCSKRRKIQGNKLPGRSTQIKTTAQF